MEMDDEAWKKFLKIIKNEQCIPFLGAGACSSFIRTGRDIANEWAKNYRYPIKETKGDLIKVAQYLELKNENPKELMVEIIKTSLEKIKPENLKPPDIHGVLASLPVKVYITTNYDDLLIKALEIEGKKPRNVVCQWYKKVPEKQDKQEINPTIKEPAVFYLHGFYENTESIVLTEKDYVNMLVKMSTEWNKLFPEWLTKKMKESSILFLGYSMEDWDFKLFFETLNGVANIKTHMVSHLSVQSPKEEKIQDYFELYFKNLNIKMYWKGCEKFSSDLKEKWDSIVQPNDHYIPQYYPGNTPVAENRRKHMSNNVEKLRDISDEDLTAILGHRAPGSDYPSTHPPLAEIGEPDCPVREVVAPTPGAAAGDRIRYSQFADSMYNAPATPFWRSYHAAINFRGVDLGTLSGRQVNEMRERDLEEYTRRQTETEITDWGLAGLRGCTVHGHSLRLQEDGTMFDMLDRRRLEGGVMVMDKDQVGVPIDRRVNLGKPMSEAEAAKRTTIYRVDNVPFRSDKEVIEWTQRVWELRTIYGFKPE